MNNRWCCFRHPRRQLTEAKFMKIRQTPFVLSLGLFLCLVATNAKADAPAWMHAAVSAPLPSYDEKTDAVVIYAEDVTTVGSDGKMKGIERRVYKILRPEGRKYATVSILVDSEQKVGSMRGWCIPKEGKPYEVKDKDVTESSAAGGWELVTDRRAKVLKIPGAEPGNFVGYEIEYQTRPYVLEDQWHFQELI